MCIGREIVVVISNSRFSKRLKWLCIILTIILAIAIFAGRYPDKSKERYVPELSLSTVALNFDPNDTELEPEGGWLYNIATGKLQNAGSFPKRVCDFDAVRNTLLGIHEGMVSEVDIQDGVPIFMGAAEYEGSEFVPHTLQYRPKSGDYSALTQDGVLVLWEQETAAYRELARFDWYEYGFAYSWLEDGERVCVPDDDGISILDVETLAQYHWLTVDISYSDGGALPPACKRPFVVAPNGGFLVFCGGEMPDKIMISSIDEDGQLQSPKPLTDERYDGRCWFDFSPDGESIVYGIVKIKNALFNPNYYEIWLCHEGEHIKLMESKRTTNLGIEVYW